jgi:hypothetical protein
MVKPNKNKQTKKQIACSMALEKRKTKRRLSGSGETEITQGMIDDKLASSCVDRIQGMLPKPKQKRPPTQQQGTKNLRPWTMLPAKPLKRNVLWMTMKEQDPSSTLSLSDEIKSFADYVSLDAQEEASRKNLLYDVQDVVTSKWGHSAVQPFGSYPVGLSIFLSDIDVSILGMGVDDDEIQQQQQQPQQPQQPQQQQQQKQKQQKQKNPGAQEPVLGGQLEQQSNLTALYNKFLDSKVSNKDNKDRFIEKEKELREYSKELRTKYSKDSVEKEDEDEVEVPWSVDSKDNFSSYLNSTLEPVLNVKADPTVCTDSTVRTDSTVLTDSKVRTDSTLEADSTVFTSVPSIDLESIVLPIPLAEMVSITTVNTTHQIETTVNKVLPIGLKVTTDDDMTSAFDNSGYNRIQGNNGSMDSNIQVMDNNIFL